MAEWDELDSRIQEYVEICANLFREIKKELGPPSKERLTFWVPDPNSEFTKGKVNWSVREREVVNWDHYSFPIHGAFENHPRANELIKEIAGLADVHEGRVKFILSNLALRTGFRAQRGSRKQLVRGVWTAVTRDIEHDPGPSVTLTFVLGGCVRGRRKLDERTWLRPPRPSDFPAVVFDRFSLGAPFDKTVLHSILEAKYGEGERPQGDEIGSWLTSLRLATGLPLTAPESHHVPVGPTAFGMSSTMRSPHVATGYPPSEILRVDIGHARKIHAVMQRSPRSSHIDAAIDRLGRSIEEPSSVPQRLLYAVMGFEALLLGEEKGQTRALANRVGIFLGFVADAGQVLHDRIRRAYKLRSRYVHGADFQRKNVRELEAVYPALREDLCHAVLTAIVLGMPKRRLVKRLDEALVNPTLAIRFHRRIRKEFANNGLSSIIAGWQRLQIG